MGLGRDNQPIVSAFDGLAHNYFRLAPRVNTSDINDVDPYIEGSIDDPYTFSVVGVPPASKHHDAKAKGTDLDPGLA